MNNAYLNDPARGALSEHNDCAVRALAAAADVPYIDAHAALELAGRELRHGTYWRQLLAALSILDIEVAMPYGEPTSCNNDRIAAHSKRLAREPGRWIVSTPGHFTALIDGAYFDHIQYARRARQVTGAVRIVL